MGDLTLAIPGLSHADFLSTAASFSRATKGPSATSADLQNYLIYVSIIPFFIFMVSLFSLVVYHVVQCFTKYFDCTCRQRIIPEDVIDAEKIINSQKKTASMWLFALMFFAVVFDQLLLFDILPPSLTGSRNLISAMSRISSFLTFGSTISTRVYTLSVLIDSSVTTFQNGINLNANTCPALSTTLGASTSQLSGISSALSSNLKILDNITSLQVSATKNILNEQYAQMALSLLYVIPIILLIILTYGHFTQHAGVVKLLTKLLSFWYLIISSLCAVLLIITAVLGNICTENLFGNIVAFMVALFGSSPAFNKDSMQSLLFCPSDLSSSNSYNYSGATVIPRMNVLLVDLTQKLDTLTASGGPCYGATGLKSMRSILVSDIPGYLASFKDSTNCKSMNVNLWYEPIEQGLCLDFFNGIGSLWLSQQAMCLFLFGSIIAARICVHYYDVRALKRQVLSKKVVPSKSKDMPFRKNNPRAITGIPLNNSPTKEGSVAMIRVIREPKMIHDDSDEDNHNDFDSHLPDLEGNITLRPPTSTGTGTFNPSLTGATSIASTTNMNSTFSSFFFSSTRHEGKKISSFEEGKDEF